MKTLILVDSYANSNRKKKRIEALYRKSKSYEF